MIDRTQSGKGGAGVYDRGLGILTQYGLTAETVVRGRGTLICQTEKGWKSIREYWGSPARMEQQMQLQQHCMQEGFSLLDQVMQNQDGQVVTFGEDKTPYVVKGWFQGNECNTRSVEDVLRCMEMLARLHTTMQMERQEEIPTSDLLEECKKHNRELRRIHKFVQKKKKKNFFEERLADSISQFLEAGEKAADQMETAGYEQLREEKSMEICHGDCNQHNMIMTREGVAVINFEHWHYELQIEDLCLFMRKILDKHGWNQELGKSMLQQYEGQRRLSQDEKYHLNLCLSYPWRYWKLANYYASNPKVWISRKNTEKIEQAVALWEPWQQFLKIFPA